MTHFFPLNSTLEEDVFASRNLDKDCQDIAERLDGVGNRVDYSVSWMWERFVPLIRSGALAGEDLALLKRGLAAIESSAAFRQYGYPSRVPLREARFVCVG